MKDLHLEFPLSIFVTGFIICLLSALGLFSPAIAQSLFKIGLEIGLLGIIMGIIVFVWDK